MTARHVPIGTPVHDAEARGIQALVRALPDNYWVFSNLDLASDRRGQTFDHDAIVLAPHAVFTVELKSWGGRISGNRDRWTPVRRHRRPVAAAADPGQARERAVHCRRCEIIREHDLARGVRCDGSGLPWLAVEARASREGPVSVMGGAA